MTDILLQHMKDPSAAILSISVVAGAIIVVNRVFLRQPKKKNKTNEIPVAPHGIPILGHALRYKNDPPSFLREAQAAVGPVFRINLAGRYMVIVGSDSSVVQQVAFLPESIMSARQAVADIGFEYTLGPTNVFSGTDFHKRVLKDQVLHPNKYESEFLGRLCREMSFAMEKELQNAKKTDSSGRVHVSDLFDFVRRCMMRTVLNGLVGSCLLESDDTIVEEMMVFQDMIEDATAKGAVLPRSISVPFVLQPVANARQKLKKKLADRIEEERRRRERIRDENLDNDRRWGPWLRTFEESNTSLEDMAELIIGLVFAAHKNPAIGAAQSFCFLLSKGNPEDVISAEAEAKILLHETAFLTFDGLKRATTLYNCVMETARLTAHSIGSLRLACQRVDVKTKCGKSYTIEKDDVVSISHQLINTDLQNWGQDALDYNPERFVSTMKENHKAHDATFSHGIHKCPGERVAMNMMEIMLALLLERKSNLVGSLSPVCFERATLAQRQRPVAVSLSLLS